MEKVSEEIKEVRIPLGFVKQFQNDVRFIPDPGSLYGYMTVDRRMLISVLQSKDVTKQAELAKQLEVLRNDGFELVLMRK